MGGRDGDRLLLPAQRARIIRALSNRRCSPPSWRSWMPSFRAGTLSRDCGRGRPRRPVSRFDAPFPALLWARSAAAKPRHHVGLAKIESDRHRPIKSERGLALVSPPGARSMGAPATGRCSRSRLICSDTRATPRQKRGPVVAGPRKSGVLAPARSMPGAYRRILMSKLVRLQPPEPG